MGVFLFIAGGLLTSAGFFGIFGTIIASPWVGLTSGFAGFDYSLWPFVGLGVASWAGFLAGIYLMKLGLPQDSE